MRYKDKPNIVIYRLSNIYWLLLFFFSELKYDRTAVRKYPPFQKSESLEFTDIKNLQQQCRSIFLIQLSARAYVQNSRSLCSCLCIQAEKLLLLLMALGVMSMLLSVHTVILLSIKSTACKIKVCGYEIKTGLFVFLQKKSHISIWKYLYGTSWMDSPVTNIL